MVQTTKNVIAASQEVIEHHFDNNPVIPIELSLLSQKVLQCNDAASFT